IAPLAIAQNPAALALARTLRAAGLEVEVGDGSFRLKKSFDNADRVARSIVILGEDEVAAKTATVKRFCNGEQSKVAFDDLATALKK
ncbi:MAG TPA: His/Gly/Thr/Pro-type tRNA ligase C-terminal domain-containing protein, partial [Terriglobus sp.]